MEEPTTHIKHFDLLMLKLITWSEFVEELKKIKCIPFNCAYIRQFTVSGGLSLTNLDILVTDEEQFDELIKKLK